MVACPVMVEMYETAVTFDNCDKLIVRSMRERHTENNDASRPMSTRAPM